MKLYISFLFDSGVEEIHTIIQKESTNEEEIRNYIEETTEQTYKMFSDDTIGSLKITDENEKIIVVNLSKVSSIKMYTM